MPDVLSQLAKDMSLARADLPAGRVMLTPPICTMGEDAHFAQYDVFATLGRTLPGRSAHRSRSPSWLNTNSG